MTQAETLDFGDLQPYLPHALVTSTYAHNLRLQARGCDGVRVTRRARGCVGYTHTHTMLTNHAYQMLQAEAMGISDQRDSHDSMTGA